MQRVLRRGGEPAPARPRGEAPATTRVDREPERDDERGAAELGMVTELFLAVYFDGHFVTSESLTATKVPLRSSPLTETSRPARNWSETEPV